MINDNHPAVMRLREFFAAMNEWEWGMIRRNFSDLENLPSEEIDAEVRKRDLDMRKRLEDIFRRFCDAGETATRMKDVLHWGSRHPNYDGELERVISVEDRGDVVIVETETQNNFDGHLRYELVKKNDKWFIRDNRKGKESFDKRWHRWDL